MSADLLTLDPATFVQQHTIRSVLAIGAHPDDLDFGAAGTLAGLVACGVQVRYGIVTDGDAGGFHDQERSALATQRQHEQRVAAETIGVSTVDYLGYRDGAVVPGPDLEEDLVHLMREMRPDLVLAPHPERDWSSLQKSHPDHLATGEAVTRAIYPAVENPFAFPRLAQQGWDTVKIRYLMLYGAPATRHTVRMDVTDFVGQKLAALDCHASQHPDPEWMHQRVADQLQANHPSPSRAAELFHLVTVNGELTFAGF
ncbi:PIG-L deacetylase family protein [Auritidibacter sp. NML100628]|uniref:PIG-L deacetylase family protein n=1 Tax=Auritidibacter sp. NML100628 TaxID=2170742 RepID=UPI001F4437B8|nr:PIG-L deacetylase family protein [Auritidibacter sp. NML100628]